MKFAIEVDGTKQDNIPTEPKGTGKEKYYEVKATCDDGIKAEWDYNAWNLKVDNITKGTKCTLAFNSKLSEEDYKNYIEAGVAYRRNTYRGKDITEYLENGELFTMISSGKFDDIFVGDYMTSSTKDANSKPIIWLIADLDNYLGTGSTILKKHHATIIPATPLMNASMNSSATAANGYAGSQMFQTTLTSVLNRYIISDFETSSRGDHLIEYSSYLTNSIDASGKSISATWQTNRKLDLMSEVNVYGTTIASSNFYDSGIDNRQYAIFQLKPEYMNSYKNTAFSYWLKDVSNATSFARVGNGGASGSDSASNSTGVRPRFLIG